MNEFIFILREMFGTASEIEGIVVNNQGDFIAQIKHPLGRLHYFGKNGAIVAADKGESRKSVFERLVILASAG